jgi:hypothetical protein
MMNKNNPVTPVAQDRLLASKRLRTLAFSLRKKLAVEEVNERYRRYEARDRKLGLQRRYRLVCTFPALRMSMDGAKNHGRPHVHCDVGRNKHAASIAIDNGEMLAGKLKKRDLKVVQDWVSRRRKVLMELWVEMQAGRPVEPLIAEINETRL